MENMNCVKPTTGERLKDLRTEYKLTTKELARAIGVGDGTISNIENDKGSSSMETFMRLADYFCVSLDYLAVRTEIKTPNMDIQSAHEVFGLSEAALHHLVKLKRVGKGADELHALDGLLRYSSTWLPLMSYYLYTPNDKFTPIQGNFGIKTERIILDAIREKFEWIKEALQYMEEAEHGKH